MNASRVQIGARAALVVAVAGAVGLMAISLFFTVGKPFGTINDLAGLVMIGSLQPVMLAHYELGGPVPLWPARLSLTGATLAVVGWALIQLALVVGGFTVDLDHGATGIWAAQAVLQVVIGLWIAGASLLAGRWLPLLVRSLGIVAGVGVVLMAVGILRGGFPDVLTNVGGVGYQIVLPVWAFLLGRVFQSRAAAIDVAAPPSAEARPA